MEEKLFQFSSVGWAAGVSITRLLHKPFLHFAVKQMHIVSWTWHLRSSLLHPFSFLPFLSAFPLTLFSGFGFVFMPFYPTLYILLLIRAYSSSHRFIWTVCLTCLYSLPPSDWHTVPKAVGITAGHHHCHCSLHIHKARNCCCLLLPWSNQCVGTKCLWTGASEVESSLLDKMWPLAGSGGHSQYREQLRLWGCRGFGGGHKPFLSVSLTAGACCPSDYFTCAKLLCIYVYLLRVNAFIILILCINL